MNYYFKNISDSERFYTYEPFVQVVPLTLQGQMTSNTPSLDIMCGAWSSPALWTQWSEIWLTIGLWVWLGCGWVMWRTIHKINFSQFIGSC